MPYPRFKISAPAGEIFSFLRDVAFGAPASAADEFAASLRELTGGGAVLLTSSGRSAFRLILQALDLPAGAEIVFPAYTFHPMPVVAAALGFKPVFADVDPETWNLDPSSLAARITPRTKAVVPTHLFGLPAEMEEIMALAGRNGLAVIEDCAHALGAARSVRPAGSWGAGTMITFAPSKNLPCWGGGAAVVNDPSLLDKMTAMLGEGSPCPRSNVLRDQLFNLVSWVLTSRLIFPWTLYPAIRLADRLRKDCFDGPFLEEVEPVQACREGRKGAVTPISPLQASAGLRQIKRFRGYLERQRGNARRLRSRLSGIPELQLQNEPEGTSSSFLYVRARVEDPAGFRRALLRCGVDTKPDDMRDCSTLGIFGEQPPCPNAARLGGRCVEIPCSPFYSEKEIDDIAARISKAMTKIA